MFGLFRVYPLMITVIDTIIRRMKISDKSIGIIKAQQVELAAFYDTLTGYDAGFRY